MAQHFSELVPFFIKLAAIAVTVVGLYYLTSPYQNCLTKSSKTSVVERMFSSIEKESIYFYCRRETSW